MLEHFFSNPTSTYSNFYQINLNLNLKKVRAIAERLKRKNLLKCVKYNDINGFICSTKNVREIDIINHKNLLLNKKEEII